MRKLFETRDEELSGEEWTGSFTDAGVEDCELVVQRNRQKSGRKSKRVMT